MSLPVAYRLYLPKELVEDKTRRRKARVPDNISFKTKPDIALKQLRWACEASLPRGVVLMDAGYGASTDLRTSITVLGLTYVAGILPNTSVWAPGEEPLPPKRRSGRGRPPKLLRRDAEHRPISVKHLALNLPSTAWRKVTWRQGAAAPLASRFARVRARVAHRVQDQFRPHGHGRRHCRHQRSDPALPFAVLRAVLHSPAARALTGLSGRCVSAEAAIDLRETRCGRE
jgi:SRSO17 transposase